MAKIIRKHQKLFADIGWTGNLGQFGSFAEGAPVYSNDPDVLQALANFGEGLAGGMINNAPPSIQDMDGLFHLITRQLQYMFQSGIPEWNATCTYHVGSLVHDAVPLYPTVVAYSGPGNIYMSVINNNINKPLNINSEPYWMLVRSGRVRTDNTRTVIASFDDFVLKCTYNGAGTITVVLPDAALTNKGRMIIVKSYVPTANDDIIVQTLTGQYIDAATTNTLATIYTTRKYLSNGVDKWHVI